ncbi:hypothetical protein RJ640_010537, partial [Escallonia rubra]
FMEQDYEGMATEVSSYSNEAELELGLGLSIGGGGGGLLKAKGSPWGEYGKIMTAKDFPSGFCGTKRAADYGGDGPPDVGYSASPGVSQVVGWPPLRTYRMNSLANQAKVLNDEEEKRVGGNDECNGALKENMDNESNKNDTIKDNGQLGFVKVNIDGMPIGRKVDLNAHACYETLARTLEEMFCRPSTTINSNRSGGQEKGKATQTSKLLDGSSEFVLTYEDREGDWMLVGDVPWGMFLSTVRRLRIMKTSEANGLAPSFRERNDRHKSKPI